MLPPEVCSVLASEELLAFTERSVREGILLCISAIVRVFSILIIEGIAKFYLVRVLLQVCGCKY